MDSVKIKEKKGYKLKLETFQLNTKEKEKPTQKDYYNLNNEP
jgi:hypothetical protein